MQRSHQYLNAEVDCEPVMLRGLHKLFSTYAAGKIEDRDSNREKLEYNEVKERDHCKIQH